MTKARTYGLIIASCLCVGVFSLQAQNSPYDLILRNGRIVDRQFVVSREFWRHVISRDQDDLVYEGKDDIFDISRKEPEPTRYTSANLMTLGSNISSTVGL